MRGWAGRVAACAVLLFGGLGAVAQAPAPVAPLADDRQLIAAVAGLVAQRRALMPLVAAAKWATHQPVADPGREATVVAAAGTRALALGLAPEPVEGFFRLQIGLARDVQDQLTTHWERDGYDGPVPAPDLAHGLRPQLDALTERLLQALYLAAPVLAHGDRAVSAAVLTARWPAADGWSEADRQALVEVLLAMHYTVTPSPERARAAGTLRVGTPADYAPYSVAVSGGVVGVDVELATALAAQLGLQPVFIRTSWRELMDDLAADYFDLAVGGVSINPARLRFAEASVALSRSGKTAIGRCRDRSRFTSLPAIDTDGVTVVENPGGTNETFARQHLQHARLVIHPDNRTVFEELVSDRADVMFTDEVEIALASHEHPLLCRLLQEAYEPADKAYLALRGSGWAAAVNPWLSAQLAAGTPAKLLSEYTAPARNEQ